MTWVNAEQPEETIECSWYGQGVDIAGEKGVGKALTYSEKYFMLKFFNIPTDKDDPDSFQAKHEDKPKQEVKQETQPKATQTTKPKQSQTPPPSQDETKPVNFANFWTSCRNLGYEKEQVHAFAKVDSLKDWTREMLAELIKDLKKAKTGGQINA
jgi:hypothetical protein